MRPLKVLVVHPDATISTLLERALEEAGHQVFVATDGERAIDRFVQTPTDVMVVDLVLPGRDGVATVESIRWAPGGNEAAIVLTGTSSSPERLAQVAREIAAVATLAGPRPDARQLSAVLAEVGRGSVDSTRVLIVDDVAPPEAPRIQEGAFDDGVYTKDLHRDDIQLGAVRANAGPAAVREGADVEARAQALADASRLEGDLAEVPFPRLLTRLAEQRATGALSLASAGDPRQTITGESPKKLVFFRNGVPLHVRSNLIEECLGQVLLSSGTIDRGQLEESIARVAEGAGRQGGVLIAIGAITPHELRDALEEQQRTKIFDIFSWVAGTFHFSEKMAPPSETVTLELSLTDLVYEGVTGYMPAPRVIQLLKPHFNDFAVPVPRRLAPFQGRAKLPSYAHRLLSSLDGSKRLGELLETAPIRRGPLAQLLFALDCVGAVSYREATPSSREIALIGAGPAAGSISELANLEAELERLTNLLDAGEVARALEVALDDPTRVLAAIERLDRRLRATTAPGNAPRELRAQAYEILAKLAKLRREHELSEPPKARPGDRPTQQLRASQLAAPDEIEEDEPHPWELDATTLRDVMPKTPRVLPADALPRSAPLEELPKTPQISASAVEPTADHRPPRAFPPADPSEWDDVATLDGRGGRGADHSLTAPHGTPALVAAPTLPEGVMVGGAAIGAEWPKGRPEPSPPVSVSTTQPIAAVPELDPAALDAQVDRMLQAERAFKRGDRSLQKGRHEEALVAFGKAVSLCPEEGEFLAFLGYARHASSGQDLIAADQALEELNRGCVLAPKLDVTHLLLARVLRHRDDIVGAQSAYARALAANPDCVEALEGLRELE